MNNTNKPPVGCAYTQGTASCPSGQVLPWGEIRLCVLHAAAPALLDALLTIMSYEDVISRGIPVTHRDTARAAIAQAKRD